MPPIPQFAKVLAKLAKANPKKILANSELPKTTKDDMELIKARKIATRKSLEKTVPKKAIHNSTIYKDLQDFQAHDKLQGYKSDDRVKIFNKNNLKQFVEISWPKEATAYNVVESVVRVMVEKYMKNKE